MEGVELDDYKQGYGDIYWEKRVLYSEIMSQNVFYEVDRPRVISEFTLALLEVK
jgi:hypothetical protein